MRCGPQNSCCSSSTHNRHQMHSLDSSFARRRGERRRGLGPPPAVYFRRHKKEGEKSLFFLNQGRTKTPFAFSFLFPSRSVLAFSLFEMSFIKCCAILGAQLGISNSILRLKAGDSCRKLCAFCTPFSMKPAPKTSAISSCEKKRREIGGGREIEGG